MYGSTPRGLALVVDAHIVGFSIASRSTRCLSMACLLSSKAIAYTLKDALFWPRGAAVTVSFHMLSTDKPGSIAQPIFNNPVEGLSMEGPKL